MFDVGFQELALIFGVSLMVLGPKRLSSLVTKVGRWVGKARTMARDFRQQLENEVNLEELNKLTETQSRAAHASPMQEPPPDSTPTYPYSASETPHTDDPHADDTYSHAHAEGESPMPYATEQEQESQPDTASAAQVTANAVEQEQTPHQGDLDLSTPEEPPPLEDDSHLPPDDARRYS